MELLRTVAEAAQWRDKSGPAALVPTMGALHRAHAALMRKAREDNRLYAVSVFVNPAQFAPGEDYGAYPRDIESDLDFCRSEGAAAVFNPAPEEMYPDGSGTRVSVDSLSLTMCGASRPGHFEGVATVVAKLFNILRPARAYFGQKDYQQFRIIHRMTRDLNFITEPVLCPTVREDDGLAFSSRNRYLDRRMRAQAPGLYAALKEGESLVISGEKEVSAVNDAVRRSIIRNIPSGRIDYAGVYDPDSLEELDRIEGCVLLAAAVFLGPARLIDNLLV